MALDSLDGQEQLLGDLPVCLSSSHELGNLELARSEDRPLDAVCSVAVDAFSMTESRDRLRTLADEGVSTSRFSAEEAWHAYLCRHKFCGMGSAILLRRAAEHFCETALNDSRPFVS